MLQILNSQERNQAFLKFILFFLITVTLIIVAVFFDYRMPTKENAILQDKLSSHRQQEYTQQLFVQQMQEVDALFDSLKNNVGDGSQIIRQIDAKLTNLEQLQGSNNTLYGKMNSTITSGFSDLLDTKKKHIASAQKLSDLESQLQICKGNLADERQNQDENPR